MFSKRHIWGTDAFRRVFARLANAEDLTVYFDFVVVHFDYLPVCNFPSHLANLGSKLRYKQKDENDQSRGGLILSKSFGKIRVSKRAMTNQPKRDTSPSTVRPKPARIKRNQFLCVEMVIFNELPESSTV